MRQEASYDCSILGRQFLFYGNGTPSKSLKKILFSLACAISADLNVTKAPAKQVHLFLKQTTTSNLGASTINKLQAQ